MNPTLKNMVPFRKVLDADRFENERRDCAVRSLAIASGLTYTGAYKLCAEAGRHARRGFHNLRFIQVLRRTGFRECANLKGATIADALPALTHGRFVLYVSGHFMAVVEGVHMDMLNCLESKRRRIRWVYKLEDTSRLVSSILELRQRTNAGLTDCAEALDDAASNLAEAAELLRTRSAAIVRK